MVATIPSVSVAIILVAITVIALFCDALTYLHYQSHMIVCNGHCSYLVDITISVAIYVAYKSYN